MKKILKRRNHLYALMLCCQLALVTGLSGCNLDNIKSPNLSENQENFTTPIDGPLESAPIDVGDVETEIYGYQNLERKIFKLEKGFKEVVSFEVDGVTRDFIVYAPFKALRKEAAPVVYMLHGSSGTGEKFYNISGWVEKANKVGAIAVFPTALGFCYFEDDNFDGEFTANELKVGTKWNEGNFENGKRRLCSSDEIITLVRPKKRKIIKSLEIKDDAFYLDQTIEYLKKYHKIDTTRIYASGFSNGAGMVARLSVERSYLYAAFATHGGGNVTVESLPSEPVNVIMTLGNVDDRFLTRTGDFLYADENDLLALPLDESLAEIEALFSTIGLNVSRHNLDPLVHYTQREFVNGKEVFTYGFDSTLIGADNKLTFAVMEGVGHIYPNGTYRSPIVMADYLWARFKHLSIKD